MIMKNILQIFKNKNLCTTSAIIIESKSAKELNCGQLSPQIRAGAHDRDYTIDFVNLAQLYSQTMF